MEMQIPIDFEKLETGVEHVLEVSYGLWKAASWAEAGHEVAWAQFMIPGFDLLTAGLSFVFFQPQAQRFIHGLRNSLLIAIAPTATIASIAGCYECIEPQVSNLFKRETLSGEFMQINRYLVRELQARGLWDEQMISDIKRAEGSVQDVPRIPAELKEIFLGLAQEEAKHKLRFEVEYDDHKSPSIYVKFPYRDELPDGFADLAGKPVPMNIDGATAVIYAELGDARRQEVVSGNLGNVLHDEGRVDAARAELERVVARLRELGDRHTAAIFEAVLGTRLEHRAVDLPEIQSLDLEKVVLAKAAAAHSRLERPVLVDDTSLELAGLGGFPGPLLGALEIRHRIRRHRIRRRRHHDDHRRRRHRSRHRRRRRSGAWAATR